MFKNNLNKLHYLLSENFENIQVMEKFNTNSGPYVEIVIDNGLKCDISISKRDLEKDTFKWSYSSNPNTGDFQIERVSTIETFTKDIKDIFENNRFDKSYIKDVKSVKESVTQEIMKSADNGTLGSDIYDIVDKYGKNSTISAIEGLMGSGDIDIDGMEKIGLVKTIQKI